MTGVAHHGYQGQGRKFLIVVVTGPTWFMIEHKNVLRVVEGELSLINVVFDGLIAKIGDDGIPGLLPFNRLTRSTQMPEDVKRAIEGDLDTEPGALAEGHLTEVGLVSSPDSAPVRGSRTCLVDMEDIPSQDFQPLGSEKFLDRLHIRE